MKDPTLELMSGANILARRLNRYNVEVTPASTSTPPAFEVRYVWRALARPVMSDDRCYRQTLSEDGDTSLAALEGLLIKMRIEADQKFKELTEKAEALKEYLESSNN